MSLHQDAFLFRTATEKGYIMSKIIGVTIAGVTEWHAPSAVGDYATLCGIDANDPAIGHTGTTPPSKGQKIDCMTCRMIWDVCKTLRASDFI